MKRQASRGFTLRELLEVIAIARAWMEIAIPKSIDAMGSYGRMAAVSGPRDAATATQILLKE